MKVKAYTVYVAALSSPSPCTGRIFKNILLAAPADRADGGLVDALVGSRGLVDAAVRVGRGSVDARTGMGVCGGSADAVGSLNDMLFDAQREGIQLESEKNCFARLAQKVYIAEAGLVQDVSRVSS